MPGFSPPGTLDAFFGNASDGDADFSGPSGGILTRPSFFRTVKVGGPVGLEMSGHPLFCRRLIVDSSDPNLALTGALHCNGSDGSVIANAPGAASGFFGGGGFGGLGATPGGSGITPAGAGSPPLGPSLGGNGGAGATGPSSAGGAGGVVTPIPTPYDHFVASFFTALTGMVPTPSGLVIPSGGGGGGGGGTLSTAGGRGGGGGGGGGIVSVCAAEIVLVGDNPHFAAHGGAGGGPTPGSAAGGGGGGGAVLLTSGRIIGTLHVNVTGGTGGTGFGGRASSGANGQFFSYPL